MAAAMASPCPVFPEVGSTMVPPELSRPSRSAASIMRMPMRSLTLPPGLSISSLARTVGLTPRVTRDSLTRGVLPMASRNVSITLTGRLPPRVHPFSPTGAPPTSPSSGQHELPDPVRVAEVQRVVRSHLHRDHTVGMRVHRGHRLDAGPVRRQHHPADVVAAVVLS